MSATNKPKLSPLAVFVLCVISTAALLVLSSTQDANEATGANTRDENGAADAKQESKQDDNMKRIEKISLIEQDLARRTGVGSSDDTHDDAASSRDEKISSYAHALTDKIAKSAGELG